MAVYHQEKRIWDPGLFDDPPKEWRVSSVGALLCPWGYDLGLRERARILLVRRVEDGLWGLPAGRIEPEDESAKAAIRREVLEETGIEIPIGEFKLFQEIYHPGGTKVRFIYQAQLPRDLSREIEKLSEVFVDPPGSETDRLSLVSLGSISLFEQEAARYMRPEVLREILWCLNISR